MKQVLFWNARGARRTVFLNHFFSFTSLLDDSLLIIYETKLSTKRAQKVFSSLLRRFNMFVNPAAGASAGIIAFWPKAWGNIHFVFTSPFSIHGVLATGGTPWILSAIYAPQSSQLQSLLWSELTTISRLGFPHLILGDFNASLLQSDKLGGKPVDASPKSKNLLSFFSSSSLIDLPFTGHRFTWSNNHRKPSSKILIRLDRGFASSTWRDIHPFSHIENIARIASDHCPCILYLHSR